MRVCFTNLCLKLHPDPDPTRNDLSLTLYLKFASSLIGDVDNITTSTTIYLRRVVATEVEHQASSTKRSLLPAFMARRRLGTRRTTQPAIKRKHLIETISDSIEVGS